MSFSSVVEEFANVHNNNSECADIRDSGRDSNTLNLTHNGDDHTQLHPSNSNHINSHRSDSNCTDILPDDCDSDCNSEAVSKKSFMTRVLPKALQRKIKKYKSAFLSFKFYYYHF